MNAHVMVPPEMLASNWQATQLSGFTPNSAEVLTVGAVSSPSYALTMYPVASAAISHLEIRPFVLILATSVLDAGSADSFISHMAANPTPV
jgi:hypothetical protein